MGEVSMNGCPVDGMEMRGTPGTRSVMLPPSTVTTWEIVMPEELNQVGFPELMTERELMHFLRIPDVSPGANPHNVVDNLKRFHRLPCIHISRQPL